MRKDLVKKTLSNGITVYLYSDKNLKQFQASYSVKYGTYGYYDNFYYDEEECHMPPAMAHFIEHTLIEKSKYGNMLLNFIDKNYDTNGITYSEVTTYYFRGIEDVMESLKMLIHMVDDPVFTKEDIEEVKHAIVHEVSKTSDEKYGIAGRINTRNLHKDYETCHESGNMLGTKETTESITYDMVKRCYDAYYNDKNKFLVIGGNFKIDEMVEYLEEIYSEIKPHPCKMKPFKYPSEFEVRKEYEEIVKPVSEDYCILSYKMKNNFKFSKLLTNLYLLLYCQLKFSGDTEFVTNLIKDKIIVGGVGSYIDFFNDEITFSLTADILNQDEFLKRIESELTPDGLDEEKFELYKKELKVSEINQRDYIYRVLLRFPNNIDFTESIYIIDTIDKCNIEDLRNLIAQMDFSVKSITIIKKN